MTTSLRVAKSEVPTVFHLIGRDEDSISLAIAWGLAECEDLLRRFLRAGLGWTRRLNEPEILIHRHEPRGGITDIEVLDEGRFHLIVEAKRGWLLPTRAQLVRYAGRRSFKQSRAKSKGLVSLSECSSDYAAVHLPTKNIQGVPLRHLSWQRILSLAEASYSTVGTHEKRTLRDLIHYLRSLMSSQDQQSNLVYVVALSAETRKGWPISWIDIVRERRRYFHPVGNRRPKNPPNYLGFRYAGRLQSIHHVEKYDVIEDLSHACPGIPKTPVEPHFLYHLGRAIKPPSEVRTGPIYRNHPVWCAIDLLLTSRTIAEARDRTKARLPS